MTTNTKEIVETGTYFVSIDKFVFIIHTMYSKSIVIVKKCFQKHLCCWLNFKFLHEDSELGEIWTQNDNKLKSNRVYGFWGLLPWTNCCSTFKIGLRSRITVMFEDWLGYLCKSKKIISKNINKCIHHHTDITSAHKKVKSTMLCSLI